MITNPFLPRQPKNIISDSLGDAQDQNKGFCRLFSIKESPVEEADIFHHKTPGFPILNKNTHQRNGLNPGFLVMVFQILFQVKGES